ncbi:MULTISPECIES: Nif11-like leader peptide family natural product precursor [unclassified Nostoc]|uniref:Nif11-like leader peptide family natural product precursor n=1 Tax=unclassified Nostoc TaxID=2593658 RepID=UPI002AD3401F|nr:MULTISPECIES: Nif11-like leader peptide family natural product precursor [unclassified Nostoc]MDZ8126144.1 Nif11-like leader peptide family natural product precursor [Nostoc sp. CmiVER01]MDZ8221767.1 Nif11-like leader peptide family natural product precursor [Nostoc sp. ChiVER01]
MSIQDAKAFFNAMITDDNLRSQLKSPKTNEERAVAIRAAGYNFTPEESQQLLNQITEAAAIGSSLSDAELEAVSGGVAGAAGGPVGAGLGALGGAIVGAGTALVDGDSGGDLAKKAGIGAVGGAQGPA